MRSSRCGLMDFLLAACGVWGSSDGCARLSPVWCSSRGSPIPGTLLGACNGPGAFVVRAAGCLLTNHVAFGVWATDCFSRRSSAYAVRAAGCLLTSHAALAVQATDYFSSRPGAFAVRAAGCLFTNHAVFAVRANGCFSSRPGAFVVQAAGCGCFLFILIWVCPLKAALVHFDTTCACVIISRFPPLFGTLLGILVHSAPRGHGTGSGRSCFGAGS